MEEHIRKKMQGFEVPYEERSWNKMQEKIIADSKQRRKVSALWLVVALFSLGINALLISSLLRKDQVQNVAMYSGSEIQDLQLTGEGLTNISELNRSDHNYSTWKIKEEKEIEEAGFTMVEIEDDFDQRKADGHNGALLSDPSTAFIGERIRSEIDKTQIGGKSGINGEVALQTAGMSAEQTGTLELLEDQKSGSRPTSEESEELKIKSGSDQSSTGIARRERPSSQGSLIGPEEEDIQENSTKKSGGDDGLTKETDDFANTATEEGQSVQSDSDFDSADVKEERAKRKTHSSLPLSFLSGVYYSQQAMAISSGPGIHRNLGYQFQIDKGNLALRTGLGYRQLKFKEDFQPADLLFFSSKKGEPTRLTALGDILLDYQIDVHALELPLSVLYRFLPGRKLRPMLNAGARLNRTFSSVVNYHYEPNPNIIFERPRYTVSLSPEGLETENLNYWMLDWMLGVGMELEIDRAVVQIEAIASKNFAGNSPENIPGAIGARMAIQLKH